MGSERCQFLVFEIARQRYALDAAIVREVLRTVSCTGLPRAPEIVEGVIDLRGTVIPVLDIRRRFRLPEKGPEPSDHLIVASAGERVVALRADRAIGLVSIDQKEIVDAKALASYIGYVAGVAKRPEGLVLIHDLRTFLVEAESAALDEALAVSGESRGAP